MLAARRAGRSRGPGRLLKGLAAGALAYGLTLAGAAAGAADTPPRPTRGAGLEILVPPGQPSSPARATAEGDSREIRAAIEGLHSAMQKFFKDRNIEPVMKYYDGLLEYFSPSGAREGRQQIRKRLQSHAPRVKNFRTQISPMTIRVSGDVGWATCEVHEAYTFDDRPGEEDLICTYVLERKPEGWKIVHEHQSIKMGGAESGDELP